MAIKVLKDKAINIRCTSITQNHLEFLVKETGKSKTDVIAIALEHYLKELRSDLFIKWDENNG